jgi:hypothetical protein
MTSSRESAEFADLIAAQDRRLEREGIPMYLALASEIAQPVPQPSADHVAAGRALAAALDQYREAMAPSQRDGDHSVYISVMQALSYRDFDASRLSPTPVADDGDGPVRDGEQPPIRPHGPRDGEPAL